MKADNFDLIFERNLFQPVSVKIYKILKKSKKAMKSIFLNFFFKVAIDEAFAPISCSYGLESIDLIS